MTYKTVDLRGKIAGQPWSNAGSEKNKKSLTWHYNGPPVSNTDIDQLYFDARYHLSKDWGGGSYGNGIMYHAAVGRDGTVYLLRNFDAILWHCAHSRGNRESLAVTFLIGEGQRITAAARNAAKEFTDDTVKQYGISKKSVFGHQEWSSTACPGSAMNDFVRPYRDGKLGGSAPTPKPPSGVVLVRTKSALPAGKAIHKLPVAEAKKEQERLLKNHGIETTI